MHLADFIEANTAAIVREWGSLARARSTAAAGMSRLALHDHVEEILAAVVSDMRAPQSPADQAEKGKGRGSQGALDIAGESHAGQRGDVGLTLAQVAGELRALRASVVRLWEQSGPEFSRMDLGDLVRFNEAIDQILIESMSVYGERLNRYREQFLAAVEHDLRNPLGAIVMSADLMCRRKDLDAQSARTAARILTSAGRMKPFTVRLQRRLPPDADQRQSFFAWPMARLVRRP